MTEIKVRRVAVSATGAMHPIESLEDIYLGVDTAIITPAAEFVELLKDNRRVLRHFSQTDQVRRINAILAQLKGDGDGD